MKTIKPGMVSVLHRTIEHENKPRLLLAALVGFDLESPKRIVPEIDMYPLAQPALVAESGILDEGYAKVRGEVLVSGSCFPPGGEPTEVSFVRVKIGPVDKRLAVIGNRYWNSGVPTKPSPFSEMPIDWEHAFGGEGFEQNPKGKGFAPVDTDGVPLHALPNVELPGALINAPRDRPTPASFGAIDFSWPSRFSKTGTYDADWLKKHAFGFAPDLDPTLFNMAPEDQWFPDMLSLDDEILIENMHPEKSRIEGGLPPLTVRAFVVQNREGEEDAFKEISLRPETLRVFPTHTMGVLLLRGSLDVEEDDAADIAELLIACEDREQTPRSPSHYHEAIVIRRDKEKAAMLAFRESDLIPEAGRGWGLASAKVKEMVDWITAENHLRDNLTRKRDAEIEKAREKVLAAGMDPAEFKLDDYDREIPEPDPTNIEELEQHAAKAYEDLQNWRQESEDKKKALDDEARALYAAAGMDFDEETEKAAKANAGPPKLNAASHMQSMHDMLKLSREHGVPLEELEELAADPKYEAQLVDAEKRLREVYRMNAHRQRPVEPLGREASEGFRAEVEVARHNEIKLEDVDYSGVDLSGLDLTGIDLSKAFLEGVDLTDTILVGANLDGAVLAHAKLIGTKLAGASLCNANLGAATIDGADFTDADLSHAMLDTTKIARTSLRNVKLMRTDMPGVEFGEDVDMSGAQGEDLMVTNTDLRRVLWRGARMFKCTFIECNLAGADLEGVDLTRTLLLSCPATQANFRGATLDSTQFVMEVEMQGADFTGANMCKALLRGGNLQGAAMAGANLESADLSSCDLTGANLKGIVARSALMIRTNFTRASLEGADLLSALLTKAKLFGAQLQGANLFQADLAKVRVDGETNIDRANLERARQHPRHKS